MGAVGIEGRIGDEQVSGPGLLEFNSRPGDLFGRRTPQGPALDVRIAAIDASKVAAALGLQIEHAAVAQIKVEMGALGIKTAHDGLGPRFRIGDRRLAHDHPRHAGRIFSLFQGLQQHGQAFAFSDNAVVGLEKLHDFMGKEGEPAAAQDDGGGAAAPHGLRQLPVVRHESLGMQRIGVVDVAQGDGDNVRPKGANCVRQAILVRQAVQVQAAHLMRIGDGAGHVIQSQRIDRVGFPKCIGRDEQHLHCGAILTAER